MWRTPALAVLAACVALVAGCSKSPSASSPSPTPTPSGDVAAALQTLSGKAIYLGHQSVGFNIMDGVQALISATATAAPRLVLSSDPSSLQKGVFAHAANGSNGDPVGKTAAFQSTVQGGAGGRGDIAFFKFCYVDFTGSANVAGIFEDYRSKMAALKSAYPNVRFVHLTVPLTTESATDNAAREQFSDLIRRTYGGSEPVFDLAKVESTRPDGGTQTLDGVRALVSAYSSDGGHLNAAGAEVVAKALVVYLASL